MHAPIVLLIVAALLGVFVPLGAFAISASVQNPAAMMAVRIIALAVVPILVARIAYRQGYDHAREARRSSRAA